MHASRASEATIEGDGATPPSTDAVRPSGRQGAAVAVVAGVVAIGAVYGGTRLLVDAEALGVEEPWLAGSPFTDYRAPGVVLLTVIGGGMLLTTVAALRRSRATGRAAAAMGGALLVWGVVETLAIGYRGVAQLVLLVAFVVVPASALLAIGRGTTRSSAAGPSREAAR